MRVDLAAVWTGFPEAYRILRGLFTLSRLNKDAHPYDATDQGANLFAF